MISGSPSSSTIYQGLLQMSMVSTLLRPGGREQVYKAYIITIQMCVCMCVCRVA